jgi:hypothetical protein
MGVWGGFVAVVYTLGQIYSFAYPFANAGVNFSAHNILQATCFYAACAALSVALIFAPVAYRYWRLNATLVRISQSIHMDEKLTLDMVAAYHAPPHIGCLQEAVPVAVLPAEVTAVCGGFVNASDVGLGALSIAECNALKRRIASRGACDVELAPIAGSTLVPVSTAPPDGGSDTVDCADGDDSLSGGEETIHRRADHHPDASRTGRRSRDTLRTAVNVTSPGASSDDRNSQPFGGGDDAADGARTFSAVVGDADGAATAG